MPLTVEMLHHLWPHGSQHIPGLVEGIATAAPTIFPKYGLDSDLVIAHAMGQFSEECGAGLEMVENGNYSASRLLAVFPTHFTPSMAQRAAHNPRLVFDISYGGRMGNAPPPSDDGYNFRGRGLSQVTGREGYTKLQASLHKHGVDIDIMENPDLVSDPEYALECGVADFILCGCLPWAKKDNILQVTKHLNGGTNGLADRKTWTRRWKTALGVKG